MICLDCSPPILLGLKELVDWYLFVGWYFALFSFGYLKKNVFPLSGQSVEKLRGAKPCWKGKGVENLELTSFNDQLKVAADLLKGEEGKSHSGQVILLALRGADLHTNYERQYLKDLLDSGYSILGYYPPEYGLTKGLARSPSSDGLAVETVVQYLLDKGYKVEDIIPVGIGIGSGAVSELITHYSFRRAIMIAPFTRLEDMFSSSTVDTWEQSALNWIDSTALSGVIRDYLEFNNVEKLGRVRTKKLHIIEGEEGCKMRKRVLPTDGQKLYNAWIQRKPKGSCELKAIPDMCDCHLGLSRLKPILLP